MDFVDRKVREWRQKALEYDHDGAIAQSRVYDRLARELEEAHRGWLNEELTTPQAATYSGYDESAIRKMHADGRLPKTASGRTRRGDLPRKPGHGVHPPTPQRVADTGSGGPDLAGGVLASIHGAKP